MSIALIRALSKLGLLSRRDAGDAIRQGRVRVNGRVVRDQAFAVSLERADIDVDGVHQAAPAWRTVLFHKPRGVLTTTRDPEGRTTVFDMLGAAGAGLKAVGRLDRASTGLLLLTTDTQLADRLTDPSSGVPRTYVVTVRGRVDHEALESLTDGVSDRGEPLRASAVTLLKASGRESHLLIELREGKNREIRRLMSALGHEVTRLKRLSFGPLRLGSVPPGAWREVTRKEIDEAFGGFGPRRPASSRPSVRELRAVPLRVPPSFVLVFGGVADVAALAAGLQAEHVPGLRSPVVVRARIRVARGRAVPTHLAPASIDRLRQIGHCRLPGDTPRRPSTRASPSGSAASVRRATSPETGTRAGSTPTRSDPRPCTAASRR